MLDIKFIRDNRETVERSARAKGYQVDIEALLDLDAKRRDLQSKADELRARRNAIASQMKGGKPEPELIEQGKNVKTELAEVESHLDTTTSEFTRLLKAVPNVADDDVPIGASEGENVIAKVVGEPPVFDFQPRNHAEIAELRGWLDKERAAKVAGSRFAYLKGDLVRLHFALMNYAMSVMTNREVLRQIADAAGLSVTDKPFTLVMPPLLLKTDIYDAMDRLEPREDRYKIEGEELWLQGSAEHVLGSMHAGEIIDEAEFPVRYAGYATSFRKEAGTYGKDMEGIIRMHQFEKLEMESLTTAENSRQEHLFHVAIQEHLMQQLGLSYRVLQKCTADIGKPNARGVDIDTWFAGQGKYRETHTADLMTDYQARRLQTRVRRQDGPVELVHTADATVLSQRPLIAILENCQQADGTVRVPEVLRPFVGVDLL